MDEKIYQNCENFNSPPFFVSMTMVAIFIELNMFQFICPADSTWWRFLKFLSKNIRNWNCWFILTSFSTQSKHFLWSDQNLFQSKKKQKTKTKTEHWTYKMYYAVHCTEMLKKKAVTHWRKTNKTCVKKIVNFKLDDKCKYYIICNNSNYWHKIFLQKKKKKKKNHNNSAPISS